MKEKVFVLGDSRTGTMTLHRFLQAIGYRSIHYYVKEAKQKSPNHLHHQDNWLALRNFIDNTDIQAFSDYPTRSFYVELSEQYPDAYYILTVRKNLETWQRSMISFFSKFDINLNMENLSRVYLTVNNDIRSHFAHSKCQFLEICIDDDMIENSSDIKKFLGVTTDITLGWENKSNAYNNALFSHRFQLFDTNAENFLSYVDSLLDDSKAILSEYGWFFLANDTNHFLDFQYGLRKWSRSDLGRAVNILKKRVEYFEERSIIYEKFVIPEKSVLYREYLPRLFQARKEDPNRPSILLQKTDIKNYHYLEDYLADLKSYGFLYFRGDTHTNWLGAYFVYLYIMEMLIRKLPDRLKPVAKLSDLNPSLAAFNGDLFTQRNKDNDNALNSTWAVLQNKKDFESLILYKLPREKCVARRIDTPKAYLEAFTSRETFVFEHPDQSLPRAVIFRDSTADFMVDLLAQHFSRCVFVWHKGNVYEEVIDSEEPDIVVHLMAERFVSQYPTNDSVSEMP